MSFRGWLGLLGAGAVLLVSSRSRAQCAMDTECKGDRICDNGQCVAPAAAPAAPAPAAAPPVAATPAAAPAAVPPAPAAPPPPKMVRHSTGMMAGGIVMTALAPVALIVSGTAALAEGFCNVSFDGSNNGPKDCDYDTIIYGSLLTGVVLVAVGVPLIVVGAKREPEEPEATARITPWATPTSVGLGLRVSM